MDNKIVKDPFLFELTRETAYAPSVGGGWRAATISELTNHVVQSRHCSRKVFRMKNPTFLIALLLVTVSFGAEAAPEVLPLDARELREMTLECIPMT